MCTSSNRRSTYSLRNNTHRTKDRSPDPDSAYIQDQGSSNPAKGLAPKNQLVALERIVWNLGRRHPFGGADSWQDPHYCRTVDVERGELALFTACSPDSHR
jgi:hypothetical protein